MRREDGDVSRQGAVTEQAIDWHVRRDVLDNAGWAAFVEWLEQPGHAAAYDRVAMLDGIAVPAGPIGANDNAPARWRWWGGGAVAAGLALAIGLNLGTPQAASQLIQTRPGEPRTVALADGSRVTVGGGSIVSIAATGVDVRAGEALFHIRHNETRAFTVTAGAVALRDMGTVFDVARDRGRVLVAVAEGSVLFQPDAEAITLASGDAITVDEAGRSVVRHRVAATDVGGWSRGSLRFEAAPLGDVAAAVHRATGATLALTGDLPSRMFTGTVTLTGTADRDIPHLAALIGTKWRKNGDQWILGPEAVALR